MEKFKFYLEVGERIQDDEYDFDVINFHWFESEATDRRTAFNNLKDEMNNWVSDNGYQGDNFDVNCYAR